MRRILGLGVVAAIGLSGCGSTVGAFDGLPKGADVSDAAWPRLVDTPEPPDDRLIAGAGTQALARLNVSREAAEVRQARADAVAPVADDLLARVPQAQERRAAADAVTPVSDDLLVRLSELQRRQQVNASEPVAGNLVIGTQPARPRPLRPLDQPAVSAAFEERARRARERAARAGSG